MNLANFHQRLNETISLCLKQKISSDPGEDESLTRRRMTNRRGAGLKGKAYRTLAPYEHAGRISRWLDRKKIRQTAEILCDGKQLMATADAGSILPPLRQQLRSEALRPFAQYLGKSGADHVAIMDQVEEKRFRILRDSGRYSESRSSGLRSGRLLPYAPQDNLSDGAAEYASMGFFDVDNVPQWDTWIVMFGKYLVSWVPSQLIRLVQEGVDVNPEQCILWVDDPSLSKELIAVTLSELSAKVA
jgi:hypothetical protein